METASVSKLQTTGYFKDGFVVDIDFDLLRKQRFIESEMIKLDGIDWKIRVTTMKMIDLDGCPSVPSSTVAVHKQNIEATNSVASGDAEASGTGQSGQENESEKEYGEAFRVKHVTLDALYPSMVQRPDDVFKYEGYRIGLMASASQQKDWSFAVDKFAIAIKKGEEEEDDWDNATSHFSDGLFKSPSVVHWTSTSIDRPIYGRAGFLNVSIAANQAYEPTGKTPPHSRDCPMLLQPPSLENTCGGFLDILYKEAVIYSGTNKRLIVQVFLQYANQLSFYSLYEDKNEFQDSIGLDVRCSDRQKTFFVSLQQCMYESSFMAKHLKDRPEIDSFIIKLKIKCSSSDFKTFLQCLMPPYLRLDLIDDASTFQNILILACRFECHTLLKCCSMYLMTTRRIPLRTKIRLTTSSRLDATTIEIMRKLTIEEVEDLMRSGETVNLPDKFKIVLLNRYHELQANDQEKENPCCSKTLTENM
uniref:Uncharacterized protein n=1 Tax=Romanomermis culicivorax TaxID=13658 RepID=A0A915IQ49_ROMCU